MRRIDARTNITRIVEAARRVLEAGVGLVSLDQIAKEAGVGIATLYRHFPNREALARAVYTEIFTSEIIPLFDDLDSTSDIRATLTLVMERVLDRITNERGLVAFAGNFAAMTNDVFERLDAPLTSTLSSLQASGDIRPDILPADISRLFTMLVISLTLPGTTDTMRSRFLSLTLDALNPETAVQLPPLQSA